MSDDPRCPDCMGFRGLPRMNYEQDPPMECSNPFHKEKVIPISEPKGEPETPETPAQEPPQLSPEGKALCPYCNKSSGIRGQQANLGPYIIMVVRCAGCNKTVGMFPIGAMGDPGPMMPGGPLH